MNVIAILAALGLEQWRAFRWRGALEQLFVRYAHTLERKLNGGSTQQGTVATLAAVAPPMLVAGGVYFALAVAHPLLGLAWNVAALYLLMGFRRFSHAYTNVEAALKANDLNAARRALAAWRGVAAGELSSGDIAKLAIERGLMDSYRQVFATLFWFAVLPGPVGAVLYRAAALLAHEWRGEAKTADTTPIATSRAVFGGPARALLWLLDWIPVRLTALSFAIVGDFEDAAACWRTQARAWADEEGGEHAGIVLASGAGALGMQLGGSVPTVGGEPDVRPDLGLGDNPEADLLPSAVGLVWRALVLWLLLMLLLTLANWAP
jgi:cobalamin biosynthesis protein CobD/CbiB